MYEALLQLPLFQGLCTDDFTCIIEKVKFHFRSYSGNEVIMNQGDACNQLAFLLEGNLLSKRTDDKHGFKLIETITAPAIIEPYSLFGMYPYYESTYQAQEEVKLLVIDKSYILSELSNYEIFRLNYLNLLSNRAQVNQRKLWNTHIGSLEEKLANFFLSRCLKPEGTKTLQIGMEELAGLINETRINVSRKLNELREKNIILLRRKEIHIPEMADFLRELQP
jgi:CRP-like cAMP-binding protein